MVEIRRNDDSVLPSHTPHFCHLLSFFAYTSISIISHWASRGKKAESTHYSRQNSTTATPAPRIGTRTVTPKPRGITVRVPTGMGANSQK